MYRILTRAWQNLSVSKKLYGVVGVMALLIAIELFTLYFAMSTLSAVRAFVGGEGLWSKAQKTAVSHLQRYATTGDTLYFESFQEQLKVPMGDRAARLEMEKPDMDLAKVEDGFVQGGNHPKDVLPMVRLMRRFYEVPYLARAIDKWRTGDHLISRLMEKAGELHVEIQKNGLRRKDKIQSLMNQIFVLDDELTKVENEFSYTLGEASRWLENLLMLTLLLAVVTVESTGLYLTISFARSLNRSLNELNNAAKDFGKGNFAHQVPVRSQDELGQLAISLNQMADNLEEQIKERVHAERASETKNLFLANMSHEIRTPLNAILGFAELLADPNLPEEKRAQHAAIIKRTGKTLTSIINDILDISKIEAHQIELEPRIFSLNQLLSDINAFLSIRCLEKDIELRFERVGEMSELIESDPVRLRQILTNLIGNSIKFTEQGTVVVTYQVIEDQLAFSIKDTGIGIQPEKLDRLFRPFSQGDDSVQKKYGGTGLGLLIAKRLANILGGDVKLVHSEPGVGSEFSFTIKYKPVKSFPTDLENGQDDFADMNSRQYLKGKKILVVEDSVDNQTLANFHLGKTGAQVEFANNGKEGVDKALGDEFDMILMDIQMPVMDGYSATRELRKKGYTGVIVALTGYARREDREKCYRVGCDDYLAKPFDRESLLECVYRNIRKQSPYNYKRSAIG